MYETQMRYLEVRSALLAGNPMGNPETRVLAALLPEGFDPARRYPTVWMLDGFLGTGRSQLVHTSALGSPFGEELLFYQRSGVLPKTIFLFPDGSTRLGGSQYIDSTSCGPFMRHLVDELVPLVDGELPTIALPAARAVAGHSSGGFGALALATLRPGLFDNIIVSAADSSFELSCTMHFGPAAIALARYGGVDPFLDMVFKLGDLRRLGEEESALLEMLAMGSCYSPAPAAPGWCELPFEPTTVELRPEIWTRWQAWDPEVLVRDHGHHLRRLHHLHLDCGADDRCLAQFGHRRISRQLERMGIPHQLTEFAGGHDGTSFRYRERFERLAAAWAHLL